MPSFADLSSPVQLSTKKRQRGPQDDAYLETPGSCDSIFRHSESSASRKVLPLPSAKRLRPQEYDQVHDQQQHQHPFSNKHAERPRLQAHIPPPSPFTPFHQDQDHDGSYFPRTHQGHALSPTSPHSPDAAPKSPTLRAKPSVLAPCHICHRKPTKKTDLDSFGECHGCGQRACYVCIRQCQGWLSPQDRPTPGPADDGTHVRHSVSASFNMRDVDDEDTEMDHRGPRQLASKPARCKDSKMREKRPFEVGWQGSGHRNVICSRCCVERGTQGDVVCLGCLAGMEGA